MAASLKVAVVLVLLVCTAFVELSIVPAAEARPVPATAGRMRMAVEAVPESHGAVAEPVSEASQEDDDEALDFDQELVVLGH